MSSSFTTAASVPEWNGFWDAQPELNDPSLNCPQPCFWGNKCVYDGPGGCGFVHPGEQGTGRKLFPGRTTITENGQRWEKPVVRLIGRPQFYERRRQRLSWPQWCKKMSGKAMTAAKVDDASTSAAAYPPLPFFRPPPTQEERRHAIGNRLYALIKNMLEESATERAESGLVHPLITPGKITGMLIEDLDDAEKMTTDMGALGDMVIEACEVLINSSA